MRLLVGKLLVVTLSSAQFVFPVMCVPLSLQGVEKHRETGVGSTRPTVKIRSITRWSGTV